MSWTIMVHSPQGLVLDGMRYRTKYLTITWKVEDDEDFAEAEAKRVGGFVRPYGQHLIEPMSFIR